MKKYIFYLTASVLAVVLVSCEGTYVVRERPAAVHYNRPPAPGRDYVWISGDWVWSGGRYSWREGHWERTRESRRWVDGYWQQTRSGWKWRPGHWER